MKKFVAGLAVVVAFICTLGGSGRVVNAAARQATIYNGNVENLINRIVEEANFLDGNFFGKHYFTHTDGYKYCVMYFGENKNIYVGFKLNDDYSVIYAYVDATNKDDDDLTTDRVGMLILCTMVAVDLDSNVSHALMGELLDYIDHFKKNNYDFKKFDKTFQRFAASINKNVYLRASSIKNGKGLQFILGVAR